MIVMSPLRGAGYATPIPTTNTQARRSVDASVARLRHMTGARMQIASRGMGGFVDQVPTWAWAAGGGLVAGLVAGALLFRKR